MSNEERQMQEFLKGIDDQLGNNNYFNFDNETVAAFIQKDKDIKDAIKKHEAQKRAEEQHLKDIAQGAFYTHDEMKRAWEKDKDGTTKFLENTSKELNRNIEREKVLATVRTKSKQLEYLEDLRETDRKKLIEEKAARTTAALVEDNEAIAAHDKKIKEIVSRLDFYNEQIEALNNSEGKNT